MPRFSTHFTKMHLLLMMMMMWAFVVMTAAQDLCDPIKQYKDGDKCCRKCGPGQSMVPESKCENPQCKGCEVNEYQDSWTTKSMCKRQPYCDPNTNFEVPVEMSKTKEHECRCKLGFHCDSKDCHFCYPHKKCQPGQWAKVKGNQTHDTECQDCPHGKFSTESSWHSVCKDWTECESGYHLDRVGTNTSDNVCVQDNARQHVAVIGVVVPLVVIALVVGIVVLILRDPARRKVKGCMESCVGGEEQQKTDEPPLVNPIDVYIDIDRKEPIQQISQDDSRSSLMPEENEDEQSQESFKPIRLSEKGNYVLQENGKLYPLPRQESQTQTYTQL